MLLLLPLLITYIYIYISDSLLLTDLIGEITAVKSTVTDPPQDKNRVMATIKMDK